jgi:hypothetical protein
MLKIDAQFDINEVSYYSFLYLGSGAPLYGRLLALPANITLLERLAGDKCSRLLQN